MFGPSCRGCCDSTLTGKEIMGKSYIVAHTCRRSPLKDPDPYEFPKIPFRCLLVIVLLSGWAIKETDYGPGAIYSSPLSSFLPAPGSLLMFMARTAAPRARPGGPRGPVSSRRLPYPAQDLPQHLALHSAPTPLVPMAMTAVAVAVTAPIDEPQHPLRLVEQPPDLADVHAHPYHMVASNVKSYEAPGEKFQPESPLLE